MCKEVQNNIPTLQEIVNLINQGQKAAMEVLIILQRGRIHLRVVPHRHQDLIPLQEVRLRPVEAEAAAVQEAEVLQEEGDKIK